MIKAAIWLAFGLVCVGICTINIWLGVLSAPILYELAGSLTE